jgi:multiple sugar transport system permease protein
MPTLFAFLLWGVALGVSHVLKYGDSGKQTLFVLPPLLFTAAIVIFPTILGLYIAFTDWNLNAQFGHHFNGLDNFCTLWGDEYFWNALRNMVFYVATSSCNMSSPSVSLSCSIPTSARASSSA